MNTTGLEISGEDPLNGKHRSGVAAPSPTLARLGLPTDMIEVGSYETPHSIHRIFIHAPEPKGSNRQLALVSETRGDSQRNGKPTGFCCPLSAEKLPAVVDQVLRLLQRGQIEALESCLEHTHGARILTPEATPQATAEEKPVYWNNFFSVSGEPELVIMRPNGSKISQWFDERSKEVVLLIEASQNDQSEALGLRIAKTVSDDFEAAYPDDAALLSHKNGLDEARAVVNQLVNQSDELDLVRVLRGIEPFVSRNAHFMRSEPTSYLAESLIRTTKLPAKTEDAVLVERYNDKLLTPVETATRILSRSSYLLVSIPDHLKDASVWKKMFLSVSDKGLGFFTLCLGPKRPISLGSRNSRDSHGRASFNFDLSNLSRTEKFQWLERLISSFDASQRLFPGPISTFLASEARAQTALGLERLSPRMQRHLQSEHLDPEKSVEWFVKTLRDAFTASGNSFQELARSNSGAVVEGRNQQGDRLEFTILPGGIDDIYLYPRSAEGTSPLCIGYSATHLYQLDKTFSAFASDLARHFAQENGSTMPIKHPFRPDVFSGPIGAQKCHIMLTRATALNPAQREPRDFVCIAPKTPQERLIGTCSGGSRQDNAVIQELREFYTN